MSDNKLFALDVDHFTKSGVITDQPVIFWGYMVDTDAICDLSVEIWDYEQKKIIIPRIIWDATKKYKRPLMIKARYIKNGLKLVAKSKGYFRFIPLYQNWM